MSVYVCLSVCLSIYIYLNYHYFIKILQDSTVVLLKTNYFINTHYNMIYPKHPLTYCRDSRINYVKKDSDFMHHSQWVNWKKKCPMLKTNYNVHVTFCLFKCPCQKQNPFPFHWSYENLLNYQAESHTSISLLNYTFTPFTQLVKENWFSFEILLLIIFWHEIFFLNCYFFPHQIDLKPVSDLLIPYGSILKTSAHSRHGAS